MITIFDTPIVTPVLRFFAHIGFRLVGWRVVGDIPADVRRCVVIAIPHTSYWDFVIFLGLAFVLRRTPLVMVKHTVFWEPLGTFLRYCGAIAVDRTSPQARVRDVVALSKIYNEFVLVVTPEGTRAQVAQWKSGFYRIAEKIDVPIALGFIDGANRETGIREMFIPSGDYDRDVEKIQTLYAGIRGIREQTPSA